MELFGIGIGTIITAVGYVVAFIIGYTKLQGKVANMLENFKLHKKDIKLKLLCLIKKTLKIYLLLASIRQTISSISTELGKLTGMILIYMKMNLKL